MKYVLDVDIHPSALRHGIPAADIEHAWEFGARFVQLDSEGDWSRELCIGPDRAGNLLEILYRPAAEDFIIFHAMRLRPILARYLGKRRS
ncbi:hypothetical protein [Candidatus Poriferisodalis sp.]|uniref:hypothetical protein n=1 Tax=Candidatus Poriferisodalis sp. TaxID=3101277 RepID=UPI003B5A2C34